MMYVIFFIFIIVFAKYIIDTNATIKELKAERDKFRAISWKSHINKDSGQKLNWLYKNLKSQIQTLIDDLKATNFNEYKGNIKEDILSALKNIDSYADKIENEDMDVLNIYKDSHGKSK